MTPNPMFFLLKKIPTVRYNKITETKKTIKNKMQEVRDVF